jgi:hypothetical protein
VTSSPIATIERSRAKNTCEESTVPCLAPPENPTDIERSAGHFILTAIAAMRSNFEAERLTDMRI